MLIGGAFPSLLPHAVPFLSAKLHLDRISHHATASFYRPPHRLPRHWLLPLLVLVLLRVVALPQRRRAPPLLPLLVLVLLRASSIFPNDVALRNSSVRVLAVASSAK
jgi:hypothetical protein